MIYAQIEQNSYNYLFAKHIILRSKTINKICLYSLCGVYHDEKPVYDTSNKFEFPLSVSGLIRLYLLRYSGNTSNRYYSTKLLSTYSLQKCIYQDSYIVLYILRLYQGILPDSISVGLEHL